MPPTTQRQLPISDPRFRPTVGMDGAKHLLDLGEDDVLALIDDAQLSHAWDISAVPDSSRREIRILRSSIDAYDQHRKNPALPLSPISDAAAMKLLLPPGHDKPFLTNGELQRSLNCVSDHILNLVRAGHLKLQPSTDFGRGPYGAALITVPSFKTWLNSRRLP